MNVGSETTHLERLQADAYRRSLFESKLSTLVMPLLMNHLHTLMVCLCFRRICTHNLGYFENGQRVSIPLSTSTIASYKSTSKRELAKLDTLCSPPHHAFFRRLCCSIDDYTMIFSFSGECLERVASCLFLSQTTFLSDGWAAGREALEKPQPCRDFGSVKFI